MMTWRGAVLVHRFRNINLLMHLVEREFVVDSLLRRRGVQWITSFDTRLLDKSFEPPSSDTTLVIGGQSRTKMSEVTH